MLYMMMRGRLHLRRGPLASAWRSSAWLICGRGWASRRALLQSSLHLAWLDWHQWHSRPQHLAGPVCIYLCIFIVWYGCTVDVPILTVTSMYIDFTSVFFPPRTIGVLSASPRALVRCMRRRAERARAAPHQQCRLR